MREKALDATFQLADILFRRTDLPIIISAPCTPEDFDYWYHEVVSVKVCSLLNTEDVEKEYGEAFGLPLERYYDDVDEVSERILDYWLYDNDHGKPMERFDDDEWTDTYKPIADMMARDMPWQEYIVIECY